MRTALLAAIMSVSCGHAPGHGSHDDDPARVDAVADAYVRATIEHSPLTIELLGWPEATYDRFPDHSAAATAAWNRTVDELLARLDTLGAQPPPGSPAWITLGFLREALERDRSTRICRSELWAVDSMGWQTWIGDVAALQPVASATQRRVALARWARFAGFVDTEIANLREGLRLGYSAPRSVVERVIEQLDAMLALTVEESPFYEPARRAPELAAPFTELIVTQVRPALRRYRDFLADTYRHAAREELGVSANPDGVACWRASFRAETSLERDPAETVRLGEARVAALAREAAKIAEEAYGISDLETLQTHITADPEAGFADGAAQLAFARDTLARAHAAMDRVVAVVPTARVVVDPYPEFVGAGPSARYYEADASDGGPATYKVNLLQHPTRGEAEVVAFHEAWPGHHLQISIARALPHGHRIRELVGVGSYVEGWARYAEQVAEELGLYRTPYGRIRRRLWPGRGMVVDPGIHLYGWTRSRAVAYITAGGFSAEFAEGLVDRIAVWPAQLTSYDTGALEILSLRTEAEQRLGDRFDLRAFNACVLSEGAVTLPMLRQIVEACLP
ncbi:MAG: DUF885 domain-containing protein [Kofleriaceae bacterium]|nr:DUF885 domain-containing protein [Myxococcales bacterium]MCB9560147.1 DUF885 domain-containing protein [Kofleriaceae bacterium]MCB9571800.1 DUF885 domain-containing protein [Kofleriaceae bacterium]